MSAQLIAANLGASTKKSTRASWAKATPKLKEIGAIRISPQLQERIRDLAMFKPAIDSKPPACDLTGDHLASRAASNPGLL
jgi:hypothetical protein